MKVATKLWLTLLGLLAILGVSSLWIQHTTIAVMEKARHDVQRIENKITRAEHMQGVGLRTVDVGTALIAATSPANSEKLGAMFAARGQLLAQDMAKLQAQLVTDEDRKAFAAITQISDAARLLREEAEKTIARGDGQARRDFAYGPYADNAVKFEAAIQDFINLQKRQAQAWIAVAEAARDRMRMMAWSVTAVLLVLGVVLTRWLVQTISRPLNEAIAVSQRIGAGDLRWLQPTADRHDEFGVLLQALERMAEQLRGVVGEVRNGVTQVSLAAKEIANGNHDLSGRTEQTAANLEQTAASIEQLTATVNHSADASQQANQLAVHAVQAAERGGEVVNQVVMSMDQINTSSRKISDIIGVIDGIAFQTNILALNAAVEAARAGEQGRGFAVVAGEVRNLAQRSAEAAKEVKALITTSVQNVDAGAHQVSQAGESMQEIVASVRRVTDLIGEISAASREQREGFVQVSQAVSNLDQMTQQNAALVEESSAAAKSMDEQSQRLMHAVAIFNLGAAVQPAVKQPAAVWQPTAVAAAARANVSSPAVRSAVQPVAPQHTAATAKPVITPVIRSEDDWETF